MKKIIDYSFVSIVFIVGLCVCCFSVAKTLTCYKCTSYSAPIWIACYGCIKYGSRTNRCINLGTSNLLWKCTKGTQQDSCVEGVTRVCVTLPKGSPVYVCTGIFLSCSDIAPEGGLTNPYQQLIPNQCN
jgi:hypothetical protein